jgi:hypothetical protein
VTGALDRKTTSGFVAGTNRRRSIIVPRAGVSGV